nr:formin-2-like [Penaeus vannamei]
MSPHAHGPGLPPRPPDCPRSGIGPTPTVRDWPHAHGPGLPTPTVRDCPAHGPGLPHAHAGIAPRHGPDCPTPTFLPPRPRSGIAPTPTVRDCPHAHGPGLPPRPRSGLPPRPHCPTPVAAHSGSPDVEACRLLIQRARPSERLITTPALRDGPIYQGY